MRQSSLFSRLAFALGTLCCTGASLAEAPDTGLSQQIDAVFSEFSQRSPGCNVGVLDRGEWVHKRGYGMANLELAVPLDGRQVHRMASVSKQFTAMAVLLLAEDGMVNLEDDIRSYLPDLRDYGVRVSINAMLGHVAGMGDYDMIADSYEGPKSGDTVLLRSAAGGPFRLGNEDYLTIAEFYDVVAQLPLAQQPEQAFRYSNLAYFLLAMLVEEVSGESLREFAGRRIFTPLGMHNSFFSDDATELVANRAYGYTRDESSGAYRNDMTNLFWVGDGGLHTNLEDLRLWDRNFYAPRLGAAPDRLLARMNTANSDHRDDEGRRYANGQFLGKYSGADVFEHSGGWLGTATYYARLPELQRSLILLCNDAGADTKRLAAEVLDVLLTDEERSPGP